RLGAQPARLRCAVVDPPGGADVEDVAGALPVADGEYGLATHPPPEAQFPGWLPPPVAVDQQIVLAGKGLDRRCDRAEGVHDLGGDGREPGTRYHARILDRLAGFPPVEWMCGPAGARRRGKDPQLGA